MLLIPCPWCGPRSQIEFTYGGDATVRRPPTDAAETAWFDYVYLRDNPCGPHDELWLYHVASRTIFGGENLGWNLAKNELAAMNFMMRMMLKAEQVYIMTGPRPVLDKAKVAKHWSSILAWPAENVFSYHDAIGTGQIGGGQAALRAAVIKAKQIAA